MESLDRQLPNVDIFSQQAREALNGGTAAKTERIVASCNEPELQAWTQYGLTWADSLMGVGPDDWQARLDALREFDEQIQNAKDAAQDEMSTMTDRGTTENAVWFDTTTLRSSLDLLLEGESPSPATLFDLESFIRAVVLYDHIFCLDSDQADPRVLSERIDTNLILPLDVRDDDLTTPEWLTPLGSVIYSLYMQSTYWLWGEGRQPVQAELWQDMLSGWERILGWRPDLRDTAKAFDTGLTSSSREIVGWLARLTGDVQQEAVLLHGERRVLFPLNLITQSTARCIFNMQLTSTLGLPYAPNIARVPFRSAIVARQRATTHITSVDEAIDGAVRNYLKRLPFGERIVPLPTFVAALATRVDRVDQLVDELSILRSETAKLRAHRRELEAALKDDPNNPSKSVDTLVQLRNAVTKDAETLKLTEGSTGFMVATATTWISLAVTSPVPKAILAVLGLARMATSSAPVARGLFPRLKRPYEHTLMHFGEAARHAGQAIPRLQQLWSSPAVGDWDQFRQGLERLGRLGMS